MRYAAIAMAFALTMVAVAPAVGAQCHPRCSEVVENVSDALAGAGSDDVVTFEKDGTLSPRADFQGHALP